MDHQELKRDFKTVLDGEVTDRDLTISRDTEELAAKLADLAQARD